MCGINGILYFDQQRQVSDDVVRRMREAAVHRGPDDHGHYIDANVGLGFNRLSIIDLSGGHQPMSNEDGSVWIVFNGEIYNFSELRDELIRRGHRFRTRSDTETIVHAWEEYGEKAVEKLRGMFAFAIWDSRKKVLFAARDRLGIKPLYYTVDRERFAFASEIKSLLELPGIDRELETTVLSEYLQRRYVIGPETMLRGVLKLQPGHSLTVQGTKISIRQYWDAPIGETKPRTESDALEELESLLSECIRMHLVSDVPLGAFLSGGLDSSSVVAWMHKLGVADIKTFSIGYDSLESELPYAKQVADRFHTDHHELRLTPGGFRDVLPKIVWHMDEPVADEASIPLFYLSEFARKKVTVALSGEGSDEIFGGYEIYRRMALIGKLNRIPLAGWTGRVLGRHIADSKIRKYASMLGRPLEERYGGVSSVFSGEETARLLGSSAHSRNGNSVAAVYSRCRDESPLARMCYLDLKTWLADDLLVKADRMSMANSLELRVPFLDHVLVEFALRLPPQFKVRGGSGKYLLKNCMAKLLPADIIHREKKGFPVPLQSWFRGELANFARETLLASDGAARDILSRREIERMLDLHQHSDRSGQIYALLVLDQWRRAFCGAGARVPAQV